MQKTVHKQQSGHTYTHTNKHIHAYIHTYIHYIHSSHQANIACHKHWWYE